MKKTLDNYREIIKALPIKEKYTKEDLLIPEFLIDQEKNIEIYYAPHNEYINPDAKIFIIGITPGFEQMRTAISIAREELEKDEPIAAIQYKCKQEARFSGSLRKNIMSMLDEIELNKLLKVESCKALFEDRDELMHTVSLIPYPVFVKGQNYTGHTPKLIKSEFLMQYVRKHFIEELEQLKGKESILLIPLGKAVEEVLEQLKEEKIIKEEQILKGFPHPSGANVNRVQQLEENKESMKAFLKEQLGGK